MYVLKTVDRKYKIHIQDYRYNPKQNLIFNIETLRELIQ